MNSEPRRDDDYIFLSNGAKYWLGRIREIVSLEVEGNYTMFHLSNGQKLDVHGSLGKWEEKLPISIFFRTGRECIVNLMHVIEMRAFDSKRLSFTMQGGNEVILSRQQSVLFRKQRNL